MFCIPQVQLVKITISFNQKEAFLVFNTLVMCGVQKNYKHVFRLAFRLLPSSEILQILETHIPNTFNFQHYDKTNIT